MASPSKRANAKNQSRDASDAPDPKRVKVAIVSPRRNNTEGKGGAGSSSAVKVEVKAEDALPDEGPEVQAE